MRWHLRTRFLFTLAGFTAAILLVVGLAFNLSVRGYIKSRVTAQLDTVSANASSERRDTAKGKAGKHSEKHADRITGTTGNSIVLDGSGNLISVLDGETKIAELLADYFGSEGIDGDINYRIISLDSTKYAVLITDDPLQDGCRLVSYVDVTAILAFTSQINFVLFVIILIAIIMSVVLSRLIARSFARPVKELSDFANAIGGGDLTPRDFHFRDKEFDTLAASMNQMASDLKTEKQKQETFFQNVSHELRTPLTAIRGNAEGIACSVIDPMQAANVILAESDKLGGMVEDILYLSRMGKAAPEGTVEPVDIREILSLCAGQQRMAAEEKGIRFSFDFDEEDVLLPIREQDAQRMFGNLLSNAVRYAKSEVMLTCRKENGGVYVRVADDGEGISADDLPFIFERFYRGRGGEHGIGLAIAKAVADRYQGTIKAYNEGGAVFEVFFRGLEGRLPIILRLATKRYE